MFGLDSDAITGQPVDSGIRFAQEHIFPGHDHWETILQTQLEQRGACPAAAGRGSESQRGTTLMKLVYKADHAGNGGNAELHFPENAVLALAEVLEFLVRAVSKKMTQDVTAFAAIENEIQFGLRYMTSQRLKKPAPSLAMNRMTVDEDSVHIEDDAPQMSSIHRILPGNTGFA